MKKLIAITLCFVLAAAVFAGCRGNVNEDGTEMTGRARQHAEPTTHMTVPSMPSEPSIASEPTTGYANPSVPATDGSGSTHDGGAGSANGGSGSTYGGTGVGGADGTHGSGSTMGRG